MSGGEVEAMTILKYILITVLSVVSVVSSIGPTRKRTGLWASIVKWWKKMPFKIDRFWVVLLIVAAMVVVTAIDDYSSGQDKSELKSKIAEQNDAIKNQLGLLNSQSESLLAQERMLVEQQGTLGDQQKMMLEQAKSVGSVLFNTDTSFEGKERFLQSFHDFARIASIEADNTGFEGLVCDDGVALYWFDVETETITGFHFFTKSEINRILSGSPVSCGLVVKNGQYALGEDSELAIAFKECLFRRLPPLSSDPVVAEQTRQQILREIRTVLRYVYRAQGVDFKPLRAPCGRGELHGRFLGDYSVWFQYVVNPNAKQKRYNSVGLFDITLSKDFLDALHGLTIAEFSEKVIERFRSSRLEPKVRVKDIRILERSRLTNEWRATSPFSSRKAKIMGD